MRKPDERGFSQMLVGYVRVSADVDTAGFGTRESRRPTMFGPQNNTCRKPLTKGKARRSACRKSPPRRAQQRGRACGWWRGLCSDRSSMLVRATTCGLNFTRLTSESQLSVNDKEAAPVVGAASSIKSWPLRMSGTKKGHKPLSYPVAFPDTDKLLRDER